MPLEINILSDALSINVLHDPLGDRGSESINFNRLLEDGGDRLLEDGSYRLLES